MTTTTIHCPKCGESIAVADAVAHQAEIDLRGKIEREINQRVRTEQVAFEQATQLRLTQEQANQVAALQLTIQHQSSQLTALTQQQSLVAQREAALVLREQALEAEAQKQAEAARKQMQEQILKQVENAHRLKDLEKEKTMSDMRTQIDQLQQRLNLTSQQAQGDAAEVDLEQMLHQAFPSDKVERVKNSGDIVHTIMSDGGRECGIILWESKNTKDWNNKWVEKAVADKRDRQAAQVAIVTEAMPKDVELVGQKNGVWVISRKGMPDAAILLRTMVLELARAQFIQNVNGAKLARLRQYMLSDKFTSTVQRIISSQTNIRTSVARQRQAMNREWTSMESNSTLATDLVQEIADAVENILQEPQPQPPTRPSPPRTPGYTGDMPVAV